jgi:hypothetical protein
LACLALPRLDGTFKLTEMIDSTIEGVINGHHLSELIIKSSTGIMKLSREGVFVQDGELTKEAIQSKFKFGPWLIEIIKDNESYLMTHILDDMQIKISADGGYMNLELSGTADWSDGLFEEFTSLDVALIEKQTKIVSSTTLLVNDQYVPATSTKIDNFGSKCWKVDADKTEFLY